jgi:hypothetical protein
MARPDRAVMGGLNLTAHLVLVRGLQRLRGLQGRLALSSMEPNGCRARDEEHSRRWTRVCMTHDSVAIRSDQAASSSGHRSVHLTACTTHIAVRDFKRPDRTPEHSAPEPSRPVFGVRFGHPALFHVEQRVQKGLATRGN